MIRTLDRLAEQRAIEWTHLNQTVRTMTKHSLGGQICLTWNGSDLRSGFGDAGVDLTGGGGLCRGSFSWSRAAS
jgi:hypothetical protein